MQPYNPDGISVEKILEIERAMAENKATVTVDDKVFRLVKWDYSSRIGFVETEACRLGGVIVPANQINY